MRKDRLAWTPRFLGVVLALVLLLADQPPATAGNGTEIRFVVGHQRYYLDGRARAMDAAPFILDGRTYVPVRYLGEALGAVVDWDEATQAVTLSRGETVVKLVVNSSSIMVNGKKRDIGTTSVVMKGNRTYLPARYVAEAFGYQVGWDPDTSTVLVTAAWLEPGVVPAREEAGQGQAGREVLLAPGQGDLAEVLAAVAEGTAVRLQAGDYVLSEPLYLGKSVCLQGAGIDQTRILCDAEGYVVRVEGAELFVARDLTFQHTGQLPADVVQVDAREVDIQRCRFTGAIYDTEQRTGDGLWLQGETKGRIASCEFSGNQRDGIALAQRARPTLEENRLFANGRSGITYYGNAAGVARGNECYQNGRDGITILGQARPTLEENSCRQNRGSGLFYSYSSGGLARRNHCQDNSFQGIAVRGRANPTLEENLCLQNKEAGIGYFDTSAGTARDNLCAENEKQGIAVEGQARPTLENNRCLRNKQSGIAYFGSAGGTALGNQCGENEISGIGVEEQAAPLLEANRCFKNKEAGIAYWNSAAGMARNNECSENYISGIYLNQQAAPTLVGNRCFDNRDCGIAYWGQSSGTARSNQCWGNGVYGIYVDPQATPILQENRCFDNGCGGLEDRRKNSALQLL